MFIGTSNTCFGQVTPQINVLKNIVEEILTNFVCGILEYFMVKLRIPNHRLPGVFRCGCYVKFLKGDPDILQFLKLVYFQ